MKIQYNLIYRWGKDNEITSTNSDTYEINEIIKFLYNKFKLLPLRIEVKIEENKLGEMK